MKEFAKIVIFVLVGYSIALMAHKYAPKHRKKVTLAGMFGVFLSKHQNWQAFFAGLTGYEIAWEAGLSPIPADKPLMGLNKTRYQDSHVIEIAGQNFEYIQSSWLPIFAYNPDAPKNKWRSILSQYFSGSHRREQGVYALRKRSTGIVYYVGIVYSSERGMERVIRHFQQDSQNTRINHEPYQERDNWEVKFWQIDNPTRERLEQFEWWVHDKLNPRDSNPQSSATSFIFAQDETEEDVLRREADEYMRVYELTGEIPDEAYENPYFTPF